MIIINIRGVSISNSLLDFSTWDLGRREVDVLGGEEGRGGEARGEGRRRDLSGDVLRSGRMIMFKKVVDDFTIVSMGVALVSGSIRDTGRVHRPV